MNDLLKIEIAIELDKGNSVYEISDKFNVSESFVRSVKKKTFFENNRIKISKKKRYSYAEKSVLVERIISGDLIEDLAVEHGITEETLKRWCKKLEIIIPRSIDKISNKEKSEIIGILEEYDWKHIAKIYNISKKTICELKKLSHTKLDTETLSYLFEVLREKQRISSKTICKIMKTEGFIVTEMEIDSYKKKTKKIKNNLIKRFIRFTIHAS